ncbi:type II toxin-antitoxin system MqsR family toxin [Paenibacillus alkaliterrae]|uniref:type II toxin-antitoxin system MqsR family toxin n=1 Tax=Paenibacillus alkaliterrae TaxID=320909 RepID=UPI001F48ABF9|nr:type II toxin-antitoxin system MqsR family toxin [Paenibacillus alkaliterrae]MCF2941828.1 type II toxin-antitoxin system MqsR family toxin [Paenibacillus alkaliterrae]
MNDNAEDFLKEAKDLIRKSKRRFLPREDYEQHLIDLGFGGGVKQGWRELLKVSAENMFKPPEPDRDRPGDTVWFFKRDYNGIMAYIKLKIDERGCVCVSFKPWIDYDN